MSTNYAKYSGLGGGGGGTGTVTSVGLTAPSSILSVSGSPVTTSGTLALSLATQTANRVWAGPTTGAAANPTFRSLVTADLPFAITNLTDVGTDGIVITNGTGAVIGASPVTIAQHVADSTHNGYLSSTDWSTFNNKQSALTLGNLTDSGTDGITITGGTGAVIGTGAAISQHVADATHNGYLLNTDWVAFNGKQAAGNYITALTGDGTASGPGSVALTLATVNSNIGTFASVTVNGKGLVTAAADLSGDATTSGAALTLATVNSNVGSFGSATQVASLTVNGKGLVTAAANTSIQITESQVTNLTTDLAAKQATISFATVGSAPAAGGATISGGTVTLQPADGTNGGVVSTASQTFGGVKTFSLSPIVTALTSTKVVGTDGSKQLVSLDYRMTAGTTSLKQSDAQANIWVNNCTVAATSTATAGATTTLTNASTPIQVFTGTSAQTIKLPAGTALATGAITGYTIYIYNKSTQPLTIQDNSAGAITSMAASTYYSFVCMDTATAASSWDFHNLTPSLSNPMTTGGDVIYGGASGTPTRLANGSAGQILTSAGGTSAPTWSSTPLLALAVTTKTTTYGAATTDDLILCSGSAFTVALYTAVGNTGKTIRIKKTDASLTNIITIDGNGSETIDGALTVQCSTQYEEWTLVSDGANWQVLAHDYPQNFVALTPTFIGAGTVSSVKMYSRRVGDSLHMRGTFITGTVTGSTASISLGYGGTDGNITTAGTDKIGTTLGIVGVAQFNGTGAVTQHIIAVNGATVVNISNASGTSTGLAAALGNICWGNTQLQSVDFTVPVSGWNG